jgi:hypothetical protein
LRAKVESRRRAQRRIREKPAAQDHVQRRPSDQGDI